MTDKLHWSDGNAHALREHLARWEAEENTTGQDVGDTCNRIHDHGWRCHGEMILHPIEGVVCDACHEAAEEKT